MSAGAKRLWIFLTPGLVAVLAMASIILWLGREPDITMSLRVPGADKAPDGLTGTGTNPVLEGKLTQGSGQPADLPGAWPQFRGANHDGISTESVALAREWPGAGPRTIWSLDLGEGYAGAAVANGRLYVMDYDRDNRQDALRCLSLADGKEIWRFSYPVTVKRNHGMSRTVPVITDQVVVAMGPKCHVVCLDAMTGELRWGLDLVREYGTTVPPWYAGQCPLIEAGNVILAPGGKDALLLAVNAGSGEVVWKTPNPKGWKMTHCSVTPMEVAGKRIYVYCASLGVVGVAAEDGALLWETSDWKISIANIPSPVIVAGNRIFLSGGYNAGSLMLQLSVENGQWEVQTVFKLEPEVFGSTQQTPIFFQEHIYGVRPDGQMVCLDLQGNVVWASGSGDRFGLGPYMIADGVLFAMDDSGQLSLMEASPAKFALLAKAQVLEGRESWGPLAMAGGRLLARDLTRMVCLDIARR